jgi:iron complex outermembrane receptor protein
MNPRSTGRAVLLCTAVLMPCAVGAQQNVRSPVRTLGTVVVTGTRPSSLPLQIPTTVEGITAVDIDERINASDSEDALKYFPSLLVRKRYAGDYDHAVLATRASGTGNSARSLVYADGILISNLLGNGITFTPRWGMVTPEEIERVDVLYGPFSAAYPGNSVGAVVDYVTRMPERLEAHVRASGFGQSFDLYGREGDYFGYQGSVSVGNRTGRWSWWINANHLDSDGQPLGFANRLVSAGVPGSSGVPVEGAVAGRNPRNQAWWLLGSTTQIRTLQDHAKLKLAYDFSDSLRASYTLGYWENDALRSAQSYLRDAAGRPVYSGEINIEGRSYTLTPNDFLPARFNLAHVMHGLSIKSAAAGRFEWELAASLYDFSKDEIRTPTVFVTSAADRGAGRIADMRGTGWSNVSIKGAWRPEQSSHLIEFGYQHDAYRLRSLVSETDDWIRGGAGPRASLFRGRTRLQSLFAQDSWSPAPDWRATLGARVERWRASDGAIGDASYAELAFPAREETFFSPKAALAYESSPEWLVRASVGRAVRVPTVSELYQGSVVAGEIRNNDPNLKPEKSWTAELTAQRTLERGQLRATAFGEITEGALYSQVNVAAGSTVTTVQNVDRVRTRGIELAYSVSEALPGLDLQASVTYAHSRILRNRAFPASEGKWQPRVPDWRANALATYRWTDRWSATLGARYSGRQYNQLDNSDPNGHSFTGVSDFFVVDARIRHFLTDQCALSLGIDNLNNERYWAFHPYTQRTLMLQMDLDFGG